MFLFDHLLFAIALLKENVEIITLIILFNLIIRPTLILTLFLLIAVSLTIFRVLSGATAREEAAATSLCIVNFDAVLVGDVLILSPLIEFFFLNLLYLAH